jgi:hypothetical protein
LKSLIYSYNDIACMIVSMRTGMASLTPDVLERATAAPRKATEAAPASGRVDRPVPPKPAQNGPSIQRVYKLLKAEKIQ